MHYILQYLWMAIVGSIIAFMISYIQIARLIASHTFLSMKQEILTISVCIDELNAAIKLLYLPYENVQELRDRIAHLEVKHRTVVEELNSKMVRRNVFRHAFFKGVPRYYKQYKSRKKVGK